MNKNKLKKISEFFGLANDDELDGDTYTSNTRNKRESRSKIFRHMPEVASALKEIIILEPQIFDDVKQIADHLRLNQVIVLNLQNVNSELSRRIIDFSSGVIYAIDGSFHRVTDEIFILAPNIIDVIREPGKEITNFLSEIGIEEKL